MMFFNSQVALFRKGQSGYNEDGIWQDSTETQTTIIANVQPLNANEREQYTQVLPGGNRTISMVKIYTSAILLLDKQMGTQKADEILWLGKRYKIAMKEEWQSNIISHFRYIGVEVNQDEFGN